MHPDISRPRFVHKKLLHTICHTYSNTNTHVHKDHNMHTYKQGMLYTMLHYHAIKTHDRAEAVHTTACTCRLTHSGT